MLSPHDCSVNSSVLLSSGLPLPPRGSICGALPSIPGIACPRLAPWSRQQPENVGGVPGGGPAPGPRHTAGQRPQCGAAGGPFPGPDPHDWTSENAAHYPTHRAQKAHAGAWQARRPGWVHRGSGPHPRGQGCVPQAGRASHTQERRAISSSLLGRQRQTEAGRGLVTGEGAPLRSALTPDLEVYPPPPTLPPPGHPS